MIVIRAVGRGSPGDAHLPTARCHEHPVGGESVAFLGLLHGDRHDLLSRSAKTPVKRSGHVLNDQDRGQGGRGAGGPPREPGGHPVEMPTTMHRIGVEGVTSRSSGAAGAAGTGVIVDELEPAGDARRPEAELSLRFRFGLCDWAAEMTLLTSRSAAWPIWAN